MLSKESPPQALRSSQPRAIGELCYWFKYPSISMDKHSNKERKSWRRRGSEGRKGCEGNQSRSRQNIPRSREPGLSARPPLGRNACLTSVPRFNPSKLVSVFAKMDVGSELKPVIHLCQSVFFFLRGGKPRSRGAPVRNAPLLKESGPCGLLITRERHPRNLETSEGQRSRRR